MQHTMTYKSPLGEILLAADDEGLIGLWFAGQKYYGAGLQRECDEREVLILAEAGRWLDIYFSGKEPDFMPPLHMEGTPFRRKVWEILRRIPYGETRTYGGIAKELAASPRAVGGAVGHNPISIMVPCHRVVGAGGSLTGYAGGLDRKLRLLTLEKELLDFDFAAGVV